MILETISACAQAIGEEKLGIRLSPYSHFQGMHAENNDNLDVFQHLCEGIHSAHPRFGYIHMVESRGDPAKLANWATASGDAKDSETLDQFRNVFKGGNTEFLSAGGYTGDIAREVIRVHGGAVVFGRMFISSEWCTLLVCLHYVY
jgi:NADPH2 dehydrogenase